MLDFIRDVGAFMKDTLGNPGAFAGGIFTSVFMLLISLLFFNGLRKVDLRYLFLSAGTGRVSSTMFWNNIAFFIATIAFLVINFSQTLEGSSLEMIWLIYLGTVAGSHTVNKFLTLKYKDAAAAPDAPTTGTDMIPRPTAPDQHP